MKLLIIAIGTLMLIVAGLGSNVLSEKWHNYDTQKCIDIADNQYYSTQNNCWTTMEKPHINQLLMWILLMLLPLIAYIVFLVIVISY